MSEFQVSPLLPRPVENKLAKLISNESSTNYPAEMSLASANCGIVSHAINIYAKERHGFGAEPYIGKIDGMTFADSLRPFRHVLLRNIDKSVIIDPTPFQVLGKVGLNSYDLDKFGTPIDEIIGTNRIYEIQDNPQAIESFVGFIGQAVLKTREYSLPIRNHLAKPFDGSQAFLDMPNEEIETRLTDMWTMSNYQPDPLKERKQNFQDRVWRIAEQLLEIED